MNRGDPLAFNLVQSLSKFPKVGSDRPVVFLLAVIDDNSIKFVISMFSFSSLLKDNDTMCAKLDVIQTATFESNHLNSPQAMLFFLSLIRCFLNALHILIPSAVILPL